METKESDNNHINNSISFTNPFNGLQIHIRILSMMYLYLHRELSINEKIIQYYTNCVERSESGLLVVGILKRVVEIQ